MQVFLAVQLYCAFESSRPCLAPGHSGFHTMVVSLLSELISTPDGGEKRQVLVATPRSVRGRVLIIHSQKSITNGMLGSAGTSKIQADVSENWATVGG